MAAQWRIALFEGGRGYWQRALAEGRWVGSQRALAESISPLQAAALRLALAGVLSERLGSGARLGGMGAGIVERVAHRVRDSRLGKALNLLGDCTENYAGAQHCEDGGVDLASLAQEARRLQTEVPKATHELTKDVCHWTVAVVAPHTPSSLNMQRNTRPHYLLMGPFTESNDGDPFGKTLDVDSGEDNGNGAGQAQRAPGATGTRVDGVAHWQQDLSACHDLCRKTLHYCGIGCEGLQPGTGVRNWSRRHWKYSAWMGITEDVFHEEMFEAVVEVAREVSLLRHQVLGSAHAESKESAAAMATLDIMHQQLQDVKLIIADPRYDRT